MNKMESKRGSTLRVADPGLRVARGAARRSAGCTRGLFQISNLAALGGPPFPVPTTGYDPLSFSDERTTYGAQTPSNLASTVLFQPQRC
jgi:hypothetical protein